MEKLEEIGEGIEEHVGKKFDQLKKRKPPNLMEVADEQMKEFEKNLKKLRDKRNEKFININNNMKRRKKKQNDILEW